MSSEDAPLKKCSCPACVRIRESNATRTPEEKNDMLARVDNMINMAVMEARAKMAPGNIPSQPKE